ncbi:MAG: ROK family protein [Actinobacteria bacterium]|nr:MAG: ROK family protein [Actinomycetota bacterium]
MNEPRVIGIDLGGTKILTGIVARDGSVEHRRETPTPTESQDALLAGLDSAVEELMTDGVVALGFGIPSRLDQKTGRVEGSVNIPLEGLDFRGRMQDRFSVPVGIENDANAATYGEFHSGAGREIRSMVMLTLGTGCGGGVVIDGKLYRGWAEFGHIVIEFDGIPCQGTCTGRGHLEAYVTGTAATKLAREAFGPAADAHRLIRLADEGDAQAREILAGMGRRLGAGIGSLVNIFDPELVVIGGGFAAAWDFLIEPAREVMERESLAPAGGRVRLARAELGTAAGLIGAGLVAFDAADAA